MVHPDSPSILLAEREATAKWLQVRLPITKTKQHVRPYAQSVTDEPFLKGGVLPNPPLLASSAAWSGADVVAKSVAMLVCPLGPDPACCARPSAVLARAGPTGGRVH